MVLSSKKQEKTLLELLGLPFGSLPWRGENILSVLRFIRNITEAGLGLQPFFENFHIYYNYLKINNLQGIVRNYIKLLSVDILMGLESFLYINPHF